MSDDNDFKFIGDYAAEPTCKGNFSFPQTFRKLWPNKRVQVLPMKNCYGNYLAVFPDEKAKSKFLLSTTDEPIETNGKKLTRSITPRGEMSLGKLLELAGLPSENLVWTGSFLCVELWKAEERQRLRKDPDFFERYKSKIRRVDMSA